MNKYSFRRVYFTLALLVFHLALFAQNTGNNGAATLDSMMRSNDKIYVVMAVCLLILVTLLLYVIRIDIKLSKKEKI